MSSRPKSRTFRAMFIGVVCVAMIAGIVPANAAEQQVEGGFVAQADPRPHPYFYTHDGDGGPCPLAEEDTHKVSHAVVAPFSGWLWVQMDFPSGPSSEPCWLTWSCDRDLHLTDEDGSRLASSYYQFYYNEPVERLDYFVKKGQRVLILACNQASMEDAEVRYVLTQGRAWPVPAGKRRWERTEDFNYISPAAATTDMHVICHAGYDAGCVGTVPDPRARSVVVEVDDDLSPAVAATVYQFSSGAEVGGRSICGRSEEPIKLQPEVDVVSVVLHTGPCGDGTPAQATTGTVTMTFRNR